jgi:hypothetical protein
MTDETTPSAAPSAAPANTTPTPSIDKTSVATTPLETTPAPSPDDFDENIIPESSRDNFRKYRESQKSKVSEYEKKLNDETRRRMEYEATLSSIQAQQRNIQQQPVDIGEMPNYQSFSTIEEYRDAVVKWAKQVGAQELQGTLTQRQQQQQQQQAQIKAQQKVQEGVAKYPDFLNTVLPIASIAAQIPALTFYTNNEKNANDMLYHLGKNPVVLQALVELNKTNQWAAGKEVDRIAAALSTPPARSMSQAPAPISPVSTGGDGDIKSVLELVKKDKLDDFVARENRKELRRRKGAE